MNLLLFLLPFANTADPSFYAALSLPAGKLPAGVETTIGAVQKHDGPLFIQDQPWEPRLDNGYPNVIYDPENADGQGVWRCWYGDCISGCSSQVLLYANSSDGLTWGKPKLGLFDVGSVRKDLAHIGKANNIIMKGGGIGIYKDPHETDATKKFKAFGSGCFAPGGQAGCTGGVGSSPDGLVWGNSQALRWPQPQRYDCHSNLFWDPLENDYVATTRDGFSHGSGRDIGIQRSLPGKFDWDTRQAPALVEQGSASAQLYSQITFPFHDVYLGIVMVFDAESKDGHVHCRLAWSTNASTWAWVDSGGLLGREFIPHGAEGAPPTGNAFDSHICFAAASPVEVEGEVRVYYMGGNGPHNGARNSSLGLATLGLDRYAGLSNTGTSDAATFTTKAVKCTGATLLLSADVGSAGGQIKVGAVGAAGLGLDDAVAATANVTRSAVTFAGGKDFTSLVGKTVTLQIELSAGATVYAVGFE